MDTAPANLPLTIKPSPGGYIIFTCLGLALTACIASILRRGPSALPPVLVILAMVWGSLGLVMLWIARHRLTLLPDRLVYRRSFKDNEAYYRDMTAVSLNTVSGATRYGRQTWYILNITVQGSDRPFGISPKPFGLKDLSLFLSTLSRLAPQAQFNDLAQQMALGTFRPR